MNGDDVPKVAGVTIRVVRGAVCRIGSNIKMTANPVTIFSKITRLVNMNAMITIRQAFNESSHTGPSTVGFF